MLCKPCGVRLGLKLHVKNETCTRHQPVNPNHNMSFVCKLHFEEMNDGRRVKYNKSQLNLKLTPLRDTHAAAWDNVMISMMT